MANSLKERTQEDATNLPPGIDRLTLKDGTPHYRVRIRISDHKPISKSFKNLTPKFLASGFFGVAIGEPLKCKTPPQISQDRNRSKFLKSPKL